MYEAMLLTNVPSELWGRGIPPLSRAAGFAIALDVAEPWGGGVVEGRVEAAAARRSPLPVEVSVRLDAAWLDLPGHDTGRGRAVAVWLETAVWRETWELDALDRVNWRRFRFRLPPELPRAFEGAFAAFRWRVTARRRRRMLGWEETSVPLLLAERRLLPTVRLEETPVGRWRLSTWRSDGERDGRAGPCAVAYEPRAAADKPVGLRPTPREVLQRLTTSP